MAHDTHATPVRRYEAMQLVGSLHLEAEPDGGALVIDDRTLIAARVNKSAYLLLQALHQPRTLADLVTILTDAAQCNAAAAEASVAQLVDELVGLGWVESPGRVAGL
ncbi:PqqD family peptide modification chaperone [Ralstonia solanacearum]|uniref:PqqD family peptide modification chaperone n=1 Tax=Ralstonia solanacearum TaxID=305 RepID=UPI0013010AFA|nr:PqqD family peptide modification chaperone [Ralstonia solanacearum]